MRSYRTLQKQGNGLYEEKRSRFVASVAPVFAEDDALQFLKKIRSSSAGAGHHCYAYALDGLTAIQRFSDDGEPSGTAGTPILEVINKQELTNLIIVVSRWFGGVLLGASGLIRSYGKAASAGVADAGWMTVQSCTKTQLCVEYTLYGRIEHYLASEAYLQAGTDFGVDVTVSLFLEPERRDQFERDIAELTSAQAIIQYGKEVPAAFSPEGKFIRIVSEAESI